jgi:DNA-binding MarR family transcriptional regulator
MDKNREDLMQTLIQRIMSVMRHMHHGSIPREPPLSPPQVHLLFSIAGKNEGISVKELAERTSVTPGAITQFVDGLVERGLVTREGDLNDRRIVRLKLTELAKSQFEKFREDYLTSASRVFDVLSNDEIKQLIALFDKINTAHDIKLYKR